MEKTIKQQKTISEETLPLFTKACKEAEKDGWEYLGSPNMNGKIITQILVKYE